jgi:hypothetical protein
MIAAAAQVGRISNLEVMTKMKTNLERSDVPEAISSRRKSKALTLAINREKKKVLGHGEIIPKTAKDKFKITSTGKQSLRYMEYMDPAKKKLMMIFISDQGAWTLGHSTDLYLDGTFETCPDPFA